MTDVKVLVPTGYGLNCDHETAYAFQLAGAAAERVHINALIAGDARLEEYQILVFIGGFGWGDDHGAGVIQAVKMKTSLGERLVEFVSAGKFILGICNGFQALVNLGLLPGFDGGYHSRSVALVGNACGNFRNQWVRLAIDPESPCVFTRGILQADFPVRHGEGRFYADEEVIGRLKRNHQIVLRYARPDGSPAAGRFPDNPNGSVEDIAGICDPTGRVFGLMPHPEAFNDWTNHPDWTRERERLRRAGMPLQPGETVGVRVLRNAVDHMRSG
ncbi:MAG: phosphoribosylformylglycinamidine synthase subunit PurQ [Desulfobacteraceae bacterium]|jgi:phosphoribosylformylglycinamidine synthase|nr:phosphoribosylformylglycinamidine synthase subunit PurQ [Desulfobacteraceae bacterium]